MTRFPDDRARSPGPDSSAAHSQAQGVSPLERQAALAHGRSRRRALHFNAPVLVDGAMDLMLSLVIAHETRRPVTVAALALANHIPTDRCTALLAELRQAGMVDDAAAHQPVLSEKGLRLTREWLEREA